MNDLIPQIVDKTQVLHHIKQELQFTFVEPLSHSVQESSKWEAFIASITNSSKYMHIINSSRHTIMILFQIVSHYGWQFQ